MIIHAYISTVLQMGFMLPDYQGNMYSKVLLLKELQDAIQGEIVCTDKAGIGYGVWGVYAKYIF